MRNITLGQDRTFERYVMLMREALAIVKNQIKILSCDEHPKCRQPLFS